ncbi:unnamed protein product [Closterium sp. Naga37s-1]|nr:unnamed protein product [Closterium sp. Naga37s-1]
MARLNLEDSANAVNEAIPEAPQNSADGVEEALPAVSPASPGVEPLEQLGHGNVPFDLARISPCFSGSSLPIGGSSPGSGGSAPVFSSGMLPWLRNPSELDLNLPASPAADSAATPALAPSSAAFPSSFQVLNSSFWDSSANFGFNGGAASPPISENSSESSLVACGTESSSTDMDDEEDNNEDEDEEGDGEADSGFKSLSLKKKVSAMASLPSQRSLSSHFGGKSRTFSSLADVSAIQTIHGLAKPPPGLCLRRMRRRSRLSRAFALRHSPCAIPIAAAHRSIGKHRPGAGAGAGIRGSSFGRLAAQQVQFSLALAVSMGSVG